MNNTRYMMAVYMVPFSCERFYWIMKTIESTMKYKHNESINS